MLQPRRLGLLTLSGILGALGFPLAFPIGPRHELFAGGQLEPLAFVCLVPLLIALRGLTVRKAFGAAFLAGMVFFNGAFWWVNVAMTTFGGLPDFLSVPALELLVAWCALHWGVAGAVVRYLGRRFGWSMGLTLAPAWMATELMRNYFCSGFPWANLGYSQARNLWFAQTASVVGIYGIAFIIAGVNGALYEGLRAWRFRERSGPRALLAGWLAVLVLGHLYGWRRMVRWEKAAAQAPQVSVAVVQGNIDQKLKNEQGSLAGVVLNAYNPPTSAADRAGAELIVWPEASFPLAFPTGASSAQNVGLAQSHYRAHLLLGVDVFDPSDLRNGNENAAFLLDPDLNVRHHYTKHHLVPFGEYVLWDLDKLLPIGNLVPGTFRPGKNLDLAQFQSAGGQPVKVGIEICFDAIFPEISRTYAKEGANLLVNMTNDAWYGFSSAPYQFLRMVEMRAIETGRPFARAANTGISAFIDPVGHILQQTQVGLVQSDALQVEGGQLTPSQWAMQKLPLMYARTPYVVIGDLPSYLAAAFCVLAVAYGLLEGRRAKCRS